MSINNSSWNNVPRQQYTRPGLPYQPPVFQIQEGQLDKQAIQFVNKWDTNRDGVLSLQEFTKSEGLTGDVKTALSSPQLAQALWAVVAGPSQTLSAAEYARAVVAMDSNFDGKITQQESDRAKLGWANATVRNPGKANVQIYNDNIALGRDIGLEKKFPLTSEEKYALSLEGKDRDVKDKYPVGKDLLKGLDIGTITAFFKTLGDKGETLLLAFLAFATSQGIDADYEDDELDGLFSSGNRGTSSASSGDDAVGGLFTTPSRNTSSSATRSELDDLLELIR